MNRGRQTTVLWLTAFVVGALAIWQWGMAPWLEHHRDTARKLKSAQSRLASVQALAAQYESLRTKSTGQGSGSEVNLFGFVESIATDRGLRDHLEFMRPLNRAGQGSDQGQMVEMRFGRLDLRDLVSFLYALQQSAIPVQVDHLSIRAQSGNKYLLDVDLVVSTLSRVRQ